MTIGKTKIGWKQIGKPPPIWWRKAKKIFINTENLILIFLGLRYPPDSMVLLIIKAGSSWLIENIETILGNGQHYVPSDKTLQQNEDKKV